MNVDRAVLAFAGGLLLLSLALAWFFSAYWLLLTAFVRRSQHAPVGIHRFLPGSHCVP
jgi:hypothetical protein